MGHRVIQGCLWVCLCLILQPQLSYACHTHFTLPFSNNSSLLYSSFFMETWPLFMFLLFPQSTSPFFLVPHIKTNKWVLYFSDSTLDIIVSSSPHQERIDYVLLWTTTMQQCRFYFGFCKTLSNWYLTNLSHLKHDYLLPCC